MSTDFSFSDREASSRCVLYISNVEGFNQWVYSTIEPYILTPALELASGGGSLTAIFAERGIRIRLSDKNKANRDLLRTRFKGIETIRDIYNIDFCHPDFASRYSAAFGEFGTLIALNVLESGFFDKQALKNARYFLRLRGRLILFTPVITSMLYGSEDDPAEWDRYNGRSLQDLVKGGFEVIVTRYVNLAIGTAKQPDIPLGLSALVVARRIS